MNHKERLAEIKELYSGGDVDFDYLLTRVRTLTEALEESQESLKSIYEDMLHYSGNNCLPTRDEVVQVFDSIENCRKALEGEE